MTVTDFRACLFATVLAAFLPMSCVAPGLAQSVAAPAPRGLCMNYGHDGYTHDLAPNGTVAQDFRRLARGGVTCLRIVYNGFNDVQALPLALFAHNHGFYVISGGEWGMLDKSQLPEYRAQVLKHARWAQANGIPQFSVGNEQEARLSGISLAEWANEVVALAAAVHQVYSGTVSYEVSGELADDWAKVDLGSLDLLGLNLYAGYQYNSRALQENIAAHGMRHVYVSETNCDVEYVAPCKTDAGLAGEMKDDLLRLIREFPETAFYLYTWRAVGTDYAFGIVNYPQTLAVLGIK